MTDADQPTRFGDGLLAALPIALSYFQSRFRLGSRRRGLV